MMNRTVKKELNIERLKDKMIQKMTALKATTQKVEIQKQINMQTEKLIKTAMKMNIKKAKKLNMQKIPNNVNTLLLQSKI